MSLDKVSAFVRAAFPELTFNMLEIGARPLGENERFYQVMDQFPGSRLIGFEVDDRLCAEMNRNAKPGYQYYSQAIGGANEQTLFYNTNHPMCSSLLEPDALIADLYTSLEVMRTQTTSDLNTLTLDTFSESHGIGPVDFIKIDVQGPELYIFQAATRMLQSVSFIVTEVEFIELYRDQPLFRDVDAFLSDVGFMFHKFIGFGTRALKSGHLDNPNNTGSQVMWSDAVFVRDIRQLNAISDHTLIKNAVLAYAYGSEDLTYFLFERYDQRHPSSNLTAEFGTHMNR